MIIPFSPPDVTEAEIQEVGNVLRSGWITTGPKTKQLEKELAAWLNAKRCVCLNSQTACAEMSLRALGIGEDDEVITCAYTYTATASVVHHVGAKLVLVDCQQANPQIDYDALEAAITEKSKVIIPIDLGGIPCDYDRIYDIVERKKNLFTPRNAIQNQYGRIIVMSDAAHALGAQWHGAMVGSIADISNFSFHAVKNFTTGEGGAVTWRHIDGIDDDALYHQFQLLSLHGQSKDAFSKNQPGAWEYDIVDTYYKCNMTDIAAAIGIVQLKRYPNMLARRREIIERYDNAFAQLGIKTLNHYTGTHVSSGHLYITWLPNISSGTRNEIIKEMALAGISCNVHYKPLPMHTAYKNKGFDINDYPNSYNIFKNEITLPLYSKLTDEDVAYIIKTYCAICSRYIR
ncbi:MAG: DegT/DnrJ/EryC1/StrS family aminotransferase [Oscillospiraceae bacterium]|nr:DegT/DnrJ/EryC1/StrS family aminotransferase [Oscillospiraceae bacterium]